VAVEEEEVPFPSAPLPLHSAVGSSASPGDVDRRARGRHPSGSAGPITGRSSPTIPQSHYLCFQLTRRFILPNPFHARLSVATLILSSTTAAESQNGRQQIIRAIKKRPNARNSRLRRGPLRLPIQTYNSPASQFQDIYFFRCEALYRLSRAEKWRL
jgi:hypothetical protein